MYVLTVPFPTAVGPARTVSRLFTGPRWSHSGGFLQQGGLLMHAQPFDPPCGGDADLRHLGFGTPIPDAGQRPQQIEHTHLRQRLVVCGLLEHGGEIGLTVLQRRFDLGSRLTCLERLVQSSGTLLRGQRFECHIISSVTMNGQVGKLSQSKTKSLRRGSNTPIKVVSGPKPGQLYVQAAPPEPSGRTAWDSGAFPQSSPSSERLSSRAA